MSYHKPFDYKTSDELLKASEDLGYRLPFSENISGTEQAGGSAHGRI